MHYNKTSLISLFGPYFDPFQTSERLFETLETDVSSISKIWSRITRICQNMTSQRHPTPLGPSLRPSQDLSDTISLYMGYYYTLLRHINRHSQTQNDILRHQFQTIFDPLRP